MTKIRITGALVALAFLATGCNGIGKGSKIESIRIAQDLSKTAEEETEVKAFTCLAAPLILVGTFSKGDVGDFAFRAHWTSDDESVARVANYGDPVEGKPGQVFLRGGVVLPQPTTVERSTIIRAEYLGLTASMEVVVKPSENLRIVPAVSRMIPKSAQKFTVRAKLEGIDRDVTAVSELFFVEDGSEATATVGEEAGLQLVRGVAVGGPLTLEARFDAPCPDAPTSQVRIEDIPPGGLKLDYQEGFGAQIAERTSESLQLKVDFGDHSDPADGDSDDEGEFQRLDTFDSQLNTLFGYDRDDDGQCELLLEDNGTTAEPNPPNALTFGSLITQLNTMTAVADDDTTNRLTNICASFGATSDPDKDGPLTADNGTLSNVLPIEIVDAAIDTAEGAMTITASDPCDPTSGICTPLDPEPDPTTPEIDEGSILLLNVQSTFGGGTYTQDISKSVAFTSSEPTLASVGLGGTLVTASDISVLNTEGCPTGSTTCTAKITATWIAGGVTTNPTATIDVKINAKADE
jgi:hypothetical protein